MMRWFCTIIILGLVSACVPPDLRKYKSGSRLNSPVEEIDGPNKSTSPVLNSAASKNARSKRQPSVYALDEQTFRFRLRKSEVWDALLDVLMRNYNLTIVDEKNGLVTTEWDSFYLDSKVYRNKVTVRVRPNSRRSVDVMIHNNVEQLAQGDAQNYAQNANVWLPSSDVATETGRIAQNLALLLRQPPPVMPNGMMARGQKKNSLR